MYYSILCHSEHSRGIYNRFLHYAHFIRSSRNDKIIYNEIIICNFFGLDEFTKKKLQEREQKELLSLRMNQSGANVDENEEEIIHEFLIGKEFDNSKIDYDKNS